MAATAAAAAAGGSSHLSYVSFCFCKFFFYYSYEYFKTIYVYEWRETTAENKQGLETDASQPLGNFFFSF